MNFDGHLLKTMNYYYYYFNTLKLSFYLHPFMILSIFGAINSAPSVTELNVI